MMHLPLAPRTSEPGTIAATRKMRWWYEALADFMIAHPEMKQGEIAKHFKRSDSAISVIINTDAFRAYYRQRRNEYQSDLTQNVHEKLLNVADKSLDAILEKLEKKRDTLPLETLQKTTEMTLKSLGYGAERHPSVVVNTGNQQTTIVPAVSMDDLAVAREALRRAQTAQLEPPPPVIDVTPEPAKQGRDSDGVEDLA